MEQESTIFMNLGTALGIIIAIIVLLVATVTGNYSNWIPLLFLVFALIGRVIGYGLDSIVNHQKKRQ